MTETEHRVMGFLERYGRALSAGDLDTIADSWAVPALSIGEEEARGVATIEEVTGFFAAAGEAYRAQGIVAARPTLLGAEAIGRRLWFVDVRWQNENAAGAAVATERTRYILWEGDDGALRIRTIIAAAE